MNSELFVSGGILRKEPIITFTKRSSGAHVGIAGVAPEAFRGKTALHLIGFSFSVESAWEYENFAAELAKLMRELPTNHFAAVCNTEFEAYQLSTMGIPSLLANQSVFLDENVFHPIPGRPILWDAIYNARLMPEKRHELARDVKRLALLYDRGTSTAPMIYDDVRALLPHARFLNHEAGEGKYVVLSHEDCNNVLNSARVGLALTEAEGTMRACFEYLLGGLPVVSTRSRGGRDRYLMPPYARIVEDDPKAVAAAVAALAERNLDRRAIRAHILRLLNFERHAYLSTLNKLAKETLGLDDAFPSFAPFLGRNFTDYRPASAFVKEIFG